MIWKENDLQIFVEYTLDLGSKMMECGAEAWRADDTMMRMLKAYGLRVLNSHTMATQTHVTVKTESGEAFSSSRYVNPEKTGTDLQKLELINAAARYICEETPPVRDLPVIVSPSGPRWSWAILSGYLLGAGAFAIFFGGSIFDGIAAAAIASVIYLMEQVRSMHEQNRTIYTIVACFVSGILAQLLSALSWSIHLDMVMIGDIMLFIPGLALVNGVSELFYADILTGIYRMIEAILGAGAIAVGYAAAIVLGGVI